MKIGISDTMMGNGYGRFGEKKYEKLKEHGYDCLDYNLATTTVGLYPLSETEAETALKHEIQLAKDAGIEICQVHGPWRVPIQDSTKEDRAERMEKMKRSIRFTAFMGCKNWVIHPIMPFGTEDANTENASKTWDSNLSFMSELLQTAKEYDVTICLENMPFLNFSISKTADTLRFVKTINDDHFKICLDSGHVSVFRDELTPGEEIRKLGNEIKALHIHDNKWGFDLHQMPFNGIIDWQDVAQALKEIQFEGVFSLEYHASSKLPDALFEEVSRLYAKVAKEITKNL